MGIRLRPIPRFRLFDANGSPLNGGKIYTYQPGTSTPKATYTDYTGGTSNANPVVLSSNGEATIYWDGVYKVIATDANDVVQWTEDNYGEGEDAILTGNYNLAKNGSFEVDSNGDGAPDDWTITEYTGSGGVTLDSTEQYHGLYSLKFLSVGSGSGFVIGDYFEVQSGLTYAINFAIYSSVANIHNVVEIVWYTAAKAVISTTAVYDDETTNPTSWTYEQLEATAPATARFARVRVTGAKDDNANSGTCWLDNVSVVDVDSLYGFRFPNVNADVTSSDEELNGLDGLTASRAVVTDGSGIISESSTTSTQIGYLSTLSSNVQTQLDAKQDEASAVSGYSKGETFQIESDYGAVIGRTNALNVASTFSTSTWETIGPTGSGADHIWSALDDIPSNAVAVRLNVHSVVTITSTGAGFAAGEIYAFCANGDTSASTLSAKFISDLQDIWTAAGSGEATTISSVAEIDIPINSSGIFQLYYSENATLVTLSGQTIDIDVVGWHE